MPADSKYLNKNPWHRFAKLFTGLILGYMITALLHMIFAIVLPMHREVLITSVVTVFVVWTILMIGPFLFKNGWKAMGYYMIALLILGLIYYFIQPYNPFIHE